MQRFKTNVKRMSYETYTLHRENQSSVEHSDMYKCGTQVLQMDGDVPSQALKTITFHHVNDKQSLKACVLLR